MRTLRTNRETTTSASFDLSAIGSDGDELRYDLTQDALDAYAAATDDVVGGPVFAVVPVFAALPAASLSVAAADVRRRAVHYEQDMVFHRALQPGMTVLSSEMTGSNVT